jgi:low temperature requirement protein LtrA
MGFFTLMWFTWLQTSLFDVRFSTDSVINRIFKAISFGIMTGFAVVSSQYEPSLLTSEALINTAPAFRAMALVLMASRLALTAQYAVVFWYVRGYTKTKVPLASSMAVLFIASMLFLGTYFGFPGDFNTPATSDHHVYIGWFVGVPLYQRKWLINRRYIVVVVEALAMIAISCVWRVVSFRHTHLVERIGLLTLIIMGEGIIGLGTSVSTILQNSVSVSQSAIGTIIGGVLLIVSVSNLGS